MKPGIYELPHVEHNKEIFHKVGCRKCGSGNKWTIYNNRRSDHKDKKGFLIKCECGHKLEISKAKLQRKPDKK